MIPRGYRVADMLACPHHGPHRVDQLLPSSHISETQLGVWLASSRRVWVSWNQETGMRVERQAADSLDPAKAHTYAELLWRCYCAVPGETTADIGAGLGLTRERVRLELRNAVHRLRGALRSLDTDVPAELQPGSRLAVALYGCRGSSQRSALAPHTMGPPLPSATPDGLPSPSDP